MGIGGDHSLRTIIRKERLNSEIKRTYYNEKYKFLDENKQDTKVAYDIGLTKPKYLFICLQNFFFLFFFLGIIETERTFEFGPKTNIYPVCMSFKQLNFRKTTL